MWLRFPRLEKRIYDLLLYIVDNFGLFIRWVIRPYLLVLFNKKSSRERCLVCPRIVEFDWYESGIINFLGCYYFLTWSKSTHSYYFEYLRCYCYFKDIAHMFWAVCEHRGLVSSSCLLIECNWWPPYILVPIFSLDMLWEELGTK
jgi:hypothetical protein